MWFFSQEYISNNYSGFEKLYPLFKRGIFLDTAPLFILICGYFDNKNNTKLIQNFNANISKKGEDRNYKLYDYKYLLAFLNSLNLNQVSLLITPHIFTEFIKHLWEICENPKQFREVLQMAYKPRNYLKDINKNISCYSCICDNDLLDKKLEIGDVSILICAKNNGAVTILTDDKTFAEISDKKHKFITIYYPEIRIATIQFLLEGNKIPNEYLKDL